MERNSTTPWDIYARNIFYCGYGHPLWIPEPTEREIHIGDVGWIQEGEFKPLFNTMRPRDHPINSHKGVPKGFVVFDPPKLFISECNRFHQPIVHSYGMRSIESGAAAAAGR